MKTKIAMIAFMAMSFVVMGQETIQGVNLQAKHSGYNEAGIHDSHLKQWNRLSLGMHSENNSFVIEDWRRGSSYIRALFSVDLKGNTSTNSLSLRGQNTTPSVNNFLNKLEFSGGSHGAIVFHPGSKNELMFGFHTNGNFYWGTGRSATKKDYYSMELNGNTGELSPRSINLKGGTITNGWRSTNFNWAGHSLVFGTKPGVYAHNVIEIKPGGADQGELLSKFAMYHAKSKALHDERVSIDSRTHKPTYFDVGNVGIGTRTPDSKLAVNGTIHSKEVKVDLVGWPDFVFEESYNLPTLKEVENHIKIKGHLKNIPSAKEVAKNGVLLGEMNKNLLQKIEELTLYTIQQEKEIIKQKEEEKQQNTRIENQQKQIDELKKLVQKLVK